MWRLFLGALITGCAARDQAAYTHYLAADQASLIETQESSRRRSQWDCLAPSRRTSMYAQVVQGGTTPEMRDAMDAVVRQQLLPALRREPGFCGALNLGVRESGHGMMITFWETESQARKAPDSPELLRALAAIMAVSTGEGAPISVWYVNAAELVWTRISSRVAEASVVSK